MTTTFTICIRFISYTLYLTSHTLSLHYKDHTSLMIYYPQIVSVIISQNPKTQPISRDIHPVVTFFRTTLMLHSEKLHILKRIAILIVFL